MPTDQWIPQNENTAFSLDSSHLRQLISLSAEDRLADMEAALSDEQTHWLAQAMQASREQWQSAASTLDDADLIHLFKSLAMAEMQIAGCTVGVKSPAIAINGLLKQRGGSLPRNELLWLRQNSSNRFLPNGPVL